MDPSLRIRVQSPGISSSVIRTTPLKETPRRPGNPLLTRFGMTTTPAPMSTRGRALLSRQRNQNRNPSPLPMFRIRTSIGSWILVRRRRQVSLTTMQINTKSLMNAGRNLKTTNPLLPGIPITAHMVPCRLLQSLKAGKSTCILLC